MGEKSRSHFRRLLISIFTNIYLTTRNITQRITKKIKFSISFRITFRFVRLLIWSLLFFTIIINVVLLTILFSNRWNTMTQRANIIIKAVESNIISNQVFKEYVLEQKNFVILKKDNRIIKRIGNLPEFKRYSLRSKLIFCVDKKTNEIYFSLAKNRVLNKNQYHITIYQNIQNELEFAILFFKITIVLSFIVVLITIILGSKSNNKVLKPLKDMTMTTKKISGKNLSLRINIEGIQDELKELAETINQMMDRIENSYILQQQFTSDASHELRTPISVLQGYANMLDRWGKDDPKILAESIDVIKNETINMKELIEKLLFLARSDKNNFKINKEWFNLSLLLLEIIKETEIIDDEHEFTYKIKDSILIYADRNSLKQAFRIFIDNALKYTPPNGKIEVKALENDKNIEIFIIDNGIGIAKEDMQNIFDRFYRSDKSRARDKGGHGLGLAIAKIIIIGNKGKIIVRSKIETGTEFKIVFSKD